MPASSNGRSPAQPPPAIAVRAVSKRFDDLLALDSVDFTVDPGTVFGLLGPNGAGKTTLVRVLTTLLHPDSGSAAVQGLDVVRQAREVRRRIGLAGQYAAVDINLTGRENLRLIGRLSQLNRVELRARAEQMLERFDLLEAAGRPVREYSGGMRRRLDVAAALVAHPEVLFLDEPTTGLDLVSRNSLWALIRELVATGTTVVLTTQYLEEADRLADRIAVIDRGRLIANDTPAALKARLGATVLELAMPSETLAARAAEVLAQITGARIDQRSRKVTIVASDGSRLLIDAVHLLDRASLIPRTLQVREPTLDDVFLRLTGHPTAEQSELTAAVT